MGKINQLSPDIQKLLQLYSMGFDSAYQSLHPSERNRIRPYISSIFTKWLYCPLNYNTSLTGADILNAALCPKENTSPCAVSARLFFQKDNRREKKYVFQAESYSLEEHSAVKDLHTFLSYCMPAITLTEDGKLKAEDIEALSQILSNSDIYYLRYLLELAFALDLLQDMPAIYTKKAQPVAGWERFFLQKLKRILYQMIEASLRLAEEHITSHPFLQGTPITMAKLGQWLKHPVKVHQMFQFHFSSLGIDILKEWETFQKKASASYNAVALSSAYVLGALLDKWFFRILGPYLQIIRPVYPTALPIAEKLNTLYESLALYGDISMDLFTACASYTLTPIGGQLFHQEDQTDDTAVFLHKLPWEMVVGFINESFTKLKETIASENQLKPLLEILTLEIHPKGDAKHRIIAEIESKMTFAQLGQYIARLYAIKGKAALRCVPENTRKAPPSQEPFGLKGEPGSRWTFAVAKDRTYMISVKVLKKSKGRPHLTYPRVSQQKMPITMTETI